MSEQGVIDLDTTRCGICFEQYQNSDDPPERKPRTLSCGHNYCTGCLKQLAQGRESMDCPLCKQPTRVRRGVDKLPVNRGILDVIDSVHANQSAASMDMDVDADPVASSSAASSAGKKRKTAASISCQNCDQRPAVFYCSSCRGAGEYCSSCWKDVKLHKGRDSSHKKRPIHEKPVVRMCPLHPDRCLDVFCSVDQTITCDRCHVTGAHQNHKATDLKAHLQLKTEEMKRTVQEMQDLQAKLHSKADGLQQAVKTIERRGDAKRQQVLDEQKRIVASLQTAVDAILANIGRREVLCFEPLDMLQDQTQDAIDRVSRARAKLNRVLEEEQQDIDPEAFLSDAASTLQLCLTTRASVSSVETKSFQAAADKLAKCVHPETVGAADKGFSAVHDALRDLTPKAPYQTCLELAAIPDTRSVDTRELVWKGFDQMSYFNAKTAGWYDEDFQALEFFGRDYGCLFCHKCVSDESFNRLLQHIYNFLSDPSQLRDSTSQGRARVYGALVALRLLCMTYPTVSLPGPWVEMGGLSVIAGILSDATQPEGAVDLALSCIVPYTACASASEVGLLVNANMHTACMALISRYHHQDDACRRTSSTRILCQLIKRAPDLSNLIKDGFVLTLVQSLQRPVDHPKIAALVHDALQKLSTVPDGKAALQSPDVRKAFARAFEEEYPRDYSDNYCWDHASSIIGMICPDDHKLNLKLSEGVADVIRTSLRHLAPYRLLRNRGPEMMVRSAGVLQYLGFISNFADEITRQNGMRVCMDFIRLLQELRADYCTRVEFLNIVHTVYCMCTCGPGSQTGASARAEFIKLQGFELLMEVLRVGPYQADSIIRTTFFARTVCGQTDEPVIRAEDIVESVLSVLLSLCIHDDSKVAVKELPAASKDFFKRELSVRALYLKQRPWWTQMNATAKLLETLD